MPTYVGTRISLENTLNLLLVSGYRLLTRDPKRIDNMLDTFDLVSQILSIMKLFFQHNFKVNAENPSKVINIKLPAQHTNYNVISSTVAN